MQLRSSIFIWTVSLLAAALARVALAQDQPNTLTANEQAAGWKLLFDGRSLSGWQPLPTFGAPATGDWTVQDGSLVCPGTSAGWIATDQSYSDFELKLQFRGGQNVNSGVFLRSQKEGQPHITGYELQIWDHQPAGYDTGSLVGSLKASPTKILPDQWNNYDITANGDHFLIVLNGQTLLDATDPKHSSGLIGFQCQKDNKIEFRSIRIRPLSK
jgi:hypothetical protein